MNIFKEAIEASEELLAFVVPKASLKIDFKVLYSVVNTPIPTVEMI